MNIKNILGEYPIRITSPFGERVHPVTGVRKMHRGVDISCPIGTKVYSPVAAVVRFIKTNSPTAGVYLFIEDIMNGDRFGFMHLSKVLVHIGDVVQAGEEIALSGNTGRTTGPHLHFERAKNPQWESNGYCFPANEVAIDPTSKININFSNY